MKRITLNKTSLKVSPICLGTADFGDKVSQELAFKILDHFYDRGGNFIDTAAVYGRWLPSGENISEQMIGQWLRLKKTSSPVIVATKGGHYKLNAPEISRITKKDITADIENSLRTLGLETIDLY